MALHGSGLQLHSQRMGTLPGEIRHLTIPGERKIALQDKVNSLNDASDKFPNPLTFQCWKTSFKTEVCCCSSFPTEAMLWIKEVEMVESVDDPKTSQSIGGHRFPPEF